MNTYYKHDSKAICPACKQEFSFYSKKPQTFCSHKCFCSSNVGSNHYMWEGGKSLSSGYITLTTRSGEREFEHRVIAEQALGRELKKTEIIHHINGIKTDNRNCNLLICTKKYHGYITLKMAEMYQRKILGGDSHRNI